MQEPPIASRLDEKTYGPRDSLITKELIEKQINGVMTAEEVIKGTNSRELIILNTRSKKIKVHIYGIDL